MTDKSKDTGTGGINIDGKTHTMDVGASPATAASNNAASWSAGDISVDQTVKDISVPTKETFAKYLSKETLANVGSSTHPNVYPVGNGDETAVQNLSLKDASGNPASPGPQNNEAKFNADFNQQISSNNPAGLRRGAATGTGPDGNALLPNAAPPAASGGSYIKSAGALNAPIAAYTNTTVTPNLFDFTSTLVGLTDGATNIRPYQKTTNFAIDAGTSVNVFDPTKFTSVETAAELIKTKTVVNAYPVDSPISANKLNVVKLNSAAVLANSSNTNIFGSINIGSSTVISKGKLVASGKPDGNKLLANIAPLNATGKAILTDDASSYTNTTIDPNLYDYDSVKVGIADGALISAGNIRPYQKTTNLATDAGTSVNVFDPTKFTSVETAAELIKTKTEGNAYPVDSPISANKLNVVKLNSAAVLVRSPNLNIFKDINIGSSTSTIVSKGKLTNNSGNTLLANAAVAANAGGSYIKFAQSLTTSVATYTTNIATPNLFNFNSPLKVVISDGTIGVNPTNIRDIKIIPSTSSPATDGGESKNILGADATTGYYTLTAAKSYLLAGKETTNNYFPIQVEAPTVVTLNSAAVLATSTNTKRFKDINIGSSTVISKGKLINKSGTEALPDGNKLLPDAATPADSGGSYIKPAVALKAPIAAYTNTTIAPNLFDFTSTLVGLTDGAIGVNPTNIRDIKIIPSISSPATDGGESKNILGTDAAAGNYTLTAAESRLLAGNETKDNYFPIQTEAPTVVTLRDASNKPVSVTIAQNNETNTNYFTKVIVIKDADGKDVQYINSAIISTYTKVLAASSTDFKIKRGRVAADATALDGNKLLATIAPLNATGKAELTSAASSYTNTTIGPNLYDYDSVKVGIADGTLNASPTQVRDIKALPASSDVGTDGGTSKNILGTAADYTLTAIEAQALAGATTAKNKFPIDSVPTLVTFRDAGGNPVSVTAAQNNVTNAKFFTKLIEEKKVGDQTVQTISVRKLSSYTDALTSATNNLIIKRGKTENANGIDGNDLLLTIAPETAGVASLTAGAKTYTTKTLDPNLYSPLDTVYPTDALDATNIRPYHKTTNFATDKGTSVNVFDPTKSTSVETEAELIATKTKDAGNAYSVDSPIVGTGKDAKLNVVKLNSAAVLVRSPNLNIFKDINIGSSTIISKGKLVNKSSDNAHINLPDGNELLAKIAPRNEKSKLPELTPNAKAYTKSALDSNLYSPMDTGASADTRVIIGDGESIHATNIRPYHKTKNFETDKGTSVNVFDPTKSTSVETEAELIATKTKAAGNAYSVDSPVISNKLNVVKLNSKSSVSAAQNAPINHNFFTKNIFAAFVGGDKNDLQSSYTNDVDKLLINRGKTKSDNSIATNGNDILKTAVMPTVDTGTGYIKNAGIQSPAIEPYISQILKKNRFTTYQDDTTLESNSFESTPASFVGPHELKFGESIPLLTPRNYTFHRLAHIGTVLQLRSAGEIWSDTDGGGNRQAILGPGLGQLGARQSKELLDVEKLIKDLTIVPIDSKDLVYFNSDFEGTINSAFEKFSGFTAFGMTILAAVLVVAITVAITVIGMMPFLFSAFDITATGKVGVASDMKEVDTGFFSKKVRPSPAYGRPGIGSFSGGSHGTSNVSIADIISALIPIPGINTGNRLMNFFGIQSTRINFFEAVGFGVTSFFNYGLAPPGAVVVVARTLVRSILTLGSAFADLFGGGGIEQAFEILSVIKHSRLMSALNIFAQLGDDKNTFPLITGVEPDTTIRGLDAGRKISTIDALPDLAEPYVKDSNHTPKAGPWRHSKNRLYNKEGLLTRLAWASSQIPSMLITPPNMQLLAAKLRPERPLWYPGNASRMSSIEEETGRIGTPERIKIENSLDAEYVPFYFHDLRTNEIVGFHAFLTNISEDYSANYENTEGLGRVDPIRVYKSTNRKISLGFIVAALDIYDFDSMWAKINKLTTLLYPQYTAGQSISPSVDGTPSPEYTFTKPFTQQIGASPMIRLRVGSLFHSNYSKFNLSRIFGLQNSTTTINSKKSPSNIDKPTAKKLHELTFNKVTTEAELATAKLFTTAAKAAAEAAAEPAKAAAKAAAKNADAFLADDPKLLPAGQYMTEVDTFMEASNNVIVRSFESAGGKGLAGFIDSMAFDWYSGVTWDTIDGRKAPKMCKITISFTPIHDISPGLDSSGFNRAPIYPIGT